MDSATIKSLFQLITDNIFLIIFLFAALELYLVIFLARLLKKHEGVLLDVSENLLKGQSDAPAKDSEQSSRERIQSVLDYIANKTTHEPELIKVFGKNASKISERPLYSRHNRIEMIESLMSTLVQVFPLLGILGTILAIAQTAFQSGGEINVSDLSNAFVLAMDTTILGISFSILFMIAESLLRPRVEQLIHESNHFKQIISKINLF